MKARTGAEDRLEFRFSAGTTLIRLENNANRVLRPTGGVRALACKQHAKTRHLARLVALVWEGTEAGLFSCFACWSRTLNSWNSVVVRITSSRFGKIVAISFRSAFSLCETGGWRFNDVRMAYNSNGFVGLRWLSPWHFNELR